MQLAGTHCNYDCEHTGVTWIKSDALQGVMGSIPWNALLFFTLYLQLIGMSDFDASMVVSLFYGAVALGNLLGGWIGDRAAARCPNGGRIAVTQLSIFVGIPISWLLVKVCSGFTYLSSLCCFSCFTCFMSQVPVVEPCKVSLVLMQIRHVQS